MSEITTERLVEAMARAIDPEIAEMPLRTAEQCEQWRLAVREASEKARAALAALREAAGLDEAGRGCSAATYAATVLNTAGGEWCCRAAALLRAIAGDADA